MIFTGMVLLKSQSNFFFKYMQIYLFGQYLIWNYEQNEHTQGRNSKKSTAVPSHHFLPSVKENKILENIHF